MSPWVRRLSQLQAMESSPQFKVGCRCQQGEGTGWETEYGSGLGEGRDGGVGVNLLLVPAEKELNRTRDRL